MRTINEKLWEDAWFFDLKPEEKLVFVYLLTSSKTNQLGIYETSPKYIAFETGLPNALEIVKRLYPRVVFLPKLNLIWVKDFWTYQNGSGKLFEKGICNKFMKLPKEIQRVIFKESQALREIVLKFQPDYSIPEDDSTDDSPKDSNGMEGVSNEYTNPIGRSTIPYTNGMEGVSIPYPNRIEGVCKGYTNPIQGVCKGYPNGMEGVSIPYTNPIEGVLNGYSNGIDRVSEGKTNDISNSTMGYTNGIRSIGDVLMKLPQGLSTSNEGYTNGIQPSDKTSTKVENKEENSEGQGLNLSSSTLEALKSFFTRNSYMVDEAGRPKKLDLPPLKKEESTKESQPKEQPLEENQTLEEKPEQALKENQESEDISEQEILEELMRDEEPNEQKEKPNDYDQEPIETSEKIESSSDIYISVISKEDTKDIIQNKDPDLRDNISRKKIKSMGENCNGNNNIETSNRENSTIKVEDEPKNEREDKREDEAEGKQKDETVSEPKVEKECKPKSTPKAEPKEKKQKAEKTSQSTKNRKYSEEVVNFVNAFKDFRENYLKVPITYRDWHLRAYAVTSKLLKHYTAQELHEALQDLMSPYWEDKATKVLELWQFEDWLPRWKVWKYPPIKPKKKVYDEYEEEFKRLYGYYPDEEPPEEASQEGR